MHARRFFTRRRAITAVTAAAAAAGILLSAGSIAQAGSTTGTITAGRRTGQVGPEGGRSSGIGSIIGTRPVPTAGPGALIAYIRMSNGQLSQAYLIGSLIVQELLLVVLLPSVFTRRAGTLRMKRKRTAPSND